MNDLQLHTFHIPVMGLGYTIDTPLKVGKFGISSVVSIIEDELIEKMRIFYSEKEKIEYTPIPDTDIDHRTKRITGYLDLIKLILDRQVQKLKKEEFVEGSDIVKYFELLPNSSNLKKRYNIMLELFGDKKIHLQNQLRDCIQPGSIDVNIMTKCDRANYAPDGSLLPIEYNDALAALKGFALSGLTSSVVFSAGLNPRLFSYCESFDDFYPDASGVIKKEIILKVSDFRSALVQGKIFAKKGLWVSEFRIESGLNCGGHAFATEGLLLGPILQEFKDKIGALKIELFELCKTALELKNIPVSNFNPSIDITVQGGIGTHEEDLFLQEYYHVSSTGWGSPFLLVPEATNVDEETLNKLVSAKQSDYYLSYASPLGIPFNNLRISSSEDQRKERIAKNRPGSPCYKKFLSFNTEFSELPICSSSREYQNLKIKELQSRQLPDDLYKIKYDEIIEKDCLCEGLGSSVLLKNEIELSHKLSAVAICPGPNLAYFSGVYSLEDMVDHIYGRKNLLNSLRRPHVFANELKLYIDYLKNDIHRSLGEINEKKVKYYNSFKANLLEGINYYREMFIDMSPNFQSAFSELKNDLKAFENELKDINVPHLV